MRSAVDEYMIQKHQKVNYKSGKRQSKDEKAVYWLSVVIALIVVFLIVFPVIWLLPGVFMTREDLMTQPETLSQIFPGHFLRDINLNNFRRIFGVGEFDFAATLVNTLLVAGAGMMGSLIINMLAAYVFARMKFPGKRIIWMYVILTMFIPGITILFTSIRVVSDMGLMNTMAVLIIPGWASAYNIFFFRQFFYGIPESLEEAAIIDGSTRFGIFVRIFIPMSITPIIIIGATVFMGYWNSYLWPTLTITSRSRLQMMQFIFMFHNRFRGEFGLVIAATAVSLIVPIGIFAVAQRKIVEGIAITGLK